MKTNANTRQFFNGFYLLATSALTLTTLTAHAQVIASEGFDYTAGAAGNLVGDDGGTGWSIAWTDKGNLSQVVSGSLGYTDGSGNTLATSGNSLVAVTTTSGTTEGERALNSTFGALALANTADPDTVWMSYLWQGLNTTGSGSGLYRQASLMLFQGVTSSAGSGKEFLDIGMPNISATSQATVLPNISLWTANGNAGQPFSAAAPLQSTVSANNSATDFILVEATGTSTAWAAAGNSETINVWINPTLTLGVPSGSPQITYTGQDLSAINGFRIDSGSLNATFGSVGGEQQVDELNIGDTPADVEPLEVVPEPGTLSLAALGGAMAFAFMKRRNKNAK